MLFFLSCNLFSSTEPASIFCDISLSSSTAPECSPTIRSTSLPCTSNALSLPVVLSHTSEKFSLKVPSETAFRAPIPTCLARLVINASETSPSVIATFSAFCTDAVIILVLNIVLSLLTYSPTKSDTTLVVTTADEIIPAIRLSLISPVTSMSETPC